MQYFALCIDLSNTVMLCVIAFDIPYWRQWQRLIVACWCKPSFIGAISTIVVWTINLDLDNSMQYVWNYLLMSERETQYQWLRIYQFPDLSVRESKKETENQDLLQSLASIQEICTGVILQHLTTPVEDQRLTL